MPSGHLVADGNFARLRYPHSDSFVHVRGQVIFIVPAQGLNADDFAALTMGNAEGGVAHVFGLLAEDGTQQAFLGGHFRLTLGRYFAHEDIAGAPRQRQSG